jgi:hypothetical protein
LELEMKMEIDLPADHDTCSDWEDATVIWRRDAVTKLYYRDELLMERHSTRVPVVWAALTSTFE